MKKTFIVILLAVSVYSSIAQTNNTLLTKTKMKKSSSETLTKDDTVKFPLAGTWILKAAEIILADGTSAVDTAYGQDAQGVLMIDAGGQYSLQIFRPDRRKFASGDKKRGTPQEYELALLGISTHVGHIIMDTVNKTLQFKIDYAAYPNWDHTTQTRQYKLTGNELYYRLPANAGAGTIAVSIWRRVRPN